MSENGIKATLDFLVEEVKIIRSKLDSIQQVGPLNTEKINTIQNRLAKYDQVTIAIVIAVITMACAIIFKQ